MVRTLVALLLCAWGLSGALLVGLSVLALFQQPGLNVVYDTPLPLTLALILYLLPRVMLLQLLLLALRPRSEVHVARLLGASPARRQRVGGGELRWHLSGRGPFGLAVLACWWAYLDLTAASLLAPVEMVTAPQRLYNLMHYARSDALSAMTVLVVGVPVLAAALAAALRRPLLRLSLR